MAIWNGLGQAATIAQLAGMDAAGLISAIVQAVQTVQRNKVECQQLVNHVMMINDLLQLLPQSETMRRPEIRRSLNELEDALRQAYILVTSCQKRNIMYRFIMAGNQAQKFRDVRDSIDSYLRMFPVISHIDTRYSITELYSGTHPSGAEPQMFIWHSAIHQPTGMASEEMLRSFTGHLSPDSRFPSKERLGILLEERRRANNQDLREFQSNMVDGAHPLLTQPQGAAETEIYSSHSTTGDARSEEDGVGIITMMTTGTEAPFAPSSSNIASSGLTEFTLSETVTTHHVSEDNSSGGSDYTTTVTKQKIVIKLQMPCDKCRANVMALVSRIAGVISMGITGDGRDHLEIVGEQVDAIRLIIELRRNKWADAKLLQVAEVKQEEEYEDMHRTVLSAMDRTSAMEAQPTVVSAEEGAQHKPARRWTPTRSSGFGAITARILRSMRPRALSGASRPPPSPLRIVEIEDTDAPELAAATGSHLVSSAAPPPADYSAQLSQVHLPALEAVPVMTADDISFATRMTEPLLL